MGAARRERIYEWDVLRTMAFAGVVLQHLLGAMARRLELGPTGRWFCAAAFEPVRFAVPMFVFLFGCALFYVHPDGVDYKSYLKKRMMQLAVPYGLWSLVYLLYAEKPLTPGGVLGDLLCGRAGYHLWYVVMILQFVLVTPVFYAARWVLRGWRAGIAAVFGAWLVFLALAGGWPKLPMCFVSWLGFFVLGALCGADCARFSRAAARLLPLTGTVYLLSMGYAGVPQYAGGAERTGQFLLRQLPAAGLRGIYAVRYPVLVCRGAEIRGVGRPAAAVRLCRRTFV